ncbi:MAG: hypothetical protein OXC41_06025 [Gammaproteobacteria bacterium]|nr:hypothetical protein [Gammaproteobacteria bacterium]
MTAIVNWQVRVPFLTLSYIALSMLGMTANAEIPVVLCTQCAVCMWSRAKQAVLGFGKNALLPSKWYHARLT